MHLTIELTSFILIPKKELKDKLTRKFEENDAHEDQGNHCGNKL